MFCAEGTVHLTIMHYTAHLTTLSCYLLQWEICPFLTENSLVQHSSFYHKKHIWYDLHYAEQMFKIPLALFLWISATEITMSMLDIDSALILMTFWFRKQAKIHNTKCDITCKIIACILSGTLKIYTKLTKDICHILETALPLLYLSTLLLHLIIQITYFIYHIRFSMRQ